MEDPRVAVVGSEPAGIDYVREVTATQGLDTRFHTHGDRVIVSGA